MGTSDTGGIKRATGHSVLAAKVAHGNARFALFQNTYNLLFAKSTLFFPIASGWADELKEPVRDSPERSTVSRRKIAFLFLRPFTTVYPCRDVMNRRTVFPAAIEFHSERFYRES